MTHDEARRWIRAASGALSVAHAVALGAPHCAATATDSLNMLMFKHQPAVRRESLQGQPPRGSHTGTFVPPSSVAVRAAFFRLPWEREAVRQAASKRQRASTRAARGAERLGSFPTPANRAGVWSGDDSTNLSSDRGAAWGGGVPKTMPAVYSAHQPQPVRTPRLRPPPPPPLPPPTPPFLASFSTRPALVTQPGAGGGGEGDGDALGQGAAAAAVAAAAAPPQAERPRAEGMNASGASGVRSAGKVAETDGHLPPLSAASDGQMGRQAVVAAGGAAREPRAQEGARAVGAAAVGGAANGSVGEGGEGGGGGGEWCPRAARTRACEAVPMLSEAFREFDEKHPGATIIYLAHSGSRMYGTSTPNSDVDVKGIFIPDMDKELEARQQMEAMASDPTEASGALEAEAEAEVDSDAEGSEGVTRPPSQPQAAGGTKLKGGKEVTFWYSTGDTRSSNTRDDIDMELISLDRFFGQLLRGEVGGVETLHSMLVEDIGLISDPDIVPLIVRERRWLVCKQLSSWVGFVLSHLNKYRKVTHRSSLGKRKALRRKRELNAALLREARVAAAAAAATAAEPVSAAVGPTSTLPPPPSTTATPVVAASATASTSEAGRNDSAGPSGAALGAGVGGRASAGEKTAREETGTITHGAAATPGRDGVDATGAKERTIAPREAGQLDVLFSSDAGEPTTEVRRLGVISRGDAGDTPLSSKEGRILGVISRGITEAATGGSGGGRRLGVISRGGVEAGEGKTNGDCASDEEEEEEGEWEAKEVARKVRRGKLLLHARRGVMEAEELLATGKLVFPLRPKYVEELLRLKELDFSPRKVGAITAQAKRLNAIAERSGLPVEVSHEKVSAVQSEAMGVHDRRRNGRLVGLAEAGE